MNWRIARSAKKLADVMKVPPNRLYQFQAGKRNITADTALRLSRYFGMSADFWMTINTARLTKNSRPGSRLPERQLM